MLGRSDTVLELDILDLQIRTGIFHCRATIYGNQGNSESVTLLASGNPISETLIAAPIFATSG